MPLSYFSEKGTTMIKENVYKLVMNLQVNEHILVLNKFSPAWKLTTIICTSREIVVVRVAVSNRYYTKQATVN